MKTRVITAFAIALGALSTTAFGGIMPPTSYTSLSDSPFNTATSSANNFWVETFEDGVLNTLGVSASVGQVKTPRWSTDSVDFDDASLDGWGTAGHSYLVTDGMGGAVTFTFDAAALGQLPTYAGIVWTDGYSNGSMTFEAFDADNNLIDSIEVTLSHGQNGSTAEDLFLGVVFEGGISSIVLTASVGGLEMDHLQFGFSIVPLPAPALMGLAGLAAIGARRRRTRTA